MIAALFTANFLTFVQEGTFARAVMRYTQLRGLTAAETAVAARDIVDGRELERVDTVEEIDELLARFVRRAGIELDDGGPPAPYLSFVLTRDPAALRPAEDLLWRIQLDDYRALVDQPADVAVAIRNAVRSDMWSHAFLDLAAGEQPGDAPPPDSSPEASMLVVLAVRAALWRVYRIVVDPVGVPPRGPEAAAEVAKSLSIEG
jgi:hypothetical protein